MNRRGIVFLVVLGFLLPVMASAATPQQEDIHPHADVDVWVNALGYYNYYWNDLGSGNRINVNIDVTSGDDIDFYILDEDNYDTYINGGSASSHLTRENAGSISVSYTIPSSGEWHLIFRNDNWFFRKHLEGTITVTAPYVPTSPSSSAGAVMALLVIAAVVICIAVCAAKSQKDKQEGPVASQSSQTGYQVAQPSVRPTQQVGFCPYCGTPKQLFDAKFCSKCGRAFSGPDLG
ncbi:MAG: hypothetical protein E4H14_16025 [Candidatus Thorarchaeota archaeon]|nr:MAG: hypothetical protein E4H14_16025 [Candidatus Thorarchaeota archaeon]